MHFTMNSVEMVYFQTCLYMSVWDSLLGRLMEMNMHILTKNLPGKVQSILLLSILLDRGSMTTDRVNNTYFQTMIP